MLSFNEAAIAFTGFFKSFCWNIIYLRYPKVFLYIVNMVI